MDFNDYQKAALKTAIYPNQGNNFVYPVLGLNGEAGEVAEKAKKIIRDKGGVFDGEDIADIRKELGDVLWYLAVTADEFGLTLGEVAKCNLSKLGSRAERGVLGGSGDDR